jgi:hypothetical protein
LMKAQKRASLTASSVGEAAGILRAPSRLSPRLQKTLSLEHSLQFGPALGF